LAHRLVWLPGALGAVLGTALLARLPLLGALLRGYPAELFETPLHNPGLVPPTAFYPVPTSLGLLFFGGLGLLALRRYLKTPFIPTPAPWPRWGWLAVVWTLVTWAVAWIPWPALQTWRAYSFTPLWLGYLGVAAAFAQRRGYHFQQIPWGPLAGTSAVFWWVFEYLNHFVESWQYQGASFLGPLDLVAYGILPFATVLPAVACTAWSLDSPRFSAAFERGPILSPRCPKVAAALAILGSAAALLALSWAPHYLFWTLWLAPCALVNGLLALLGRPHLFSGIAQGDWRLLLQYSLAGLVTGFFWELWNFYSVPQWTYQVPWFGGWRLFEMPILGYAGYLTFGWECATVILLLNPTWLKKAAR